MRLCWMDNRFLRADTAYSYQPIKMAWIICLSKGGNKYKFLEKRLALCLILCITAGMMMTSGAESLSIPIDSNMLPNPGFLLWVQQRDTDANGFLSPAEQDAVTSMDLRKNGIQDLSSLEWFDRLEKLNCSENDLLTLELENFPVLTSLTCNENSRLSNLTLGGVPALEQLSCFRSNLSQSLCGRCRRRRSLCHQPSVAVSPGT